MKYESKMFLSSKRVETKELEINKFFYKKKKKKERNKFGEFGIGSYELMKFWENFSRRDEL